MALKRETSAKKGVIAIKCKGTHAYDPDELTDFQGNLKALAERQRKQLKRSLQKHGFRIPLFTWKKNILDGHQRVKVIQEMIADGWKLAGPLPAVEIPASNKREAKQILLQIVATYGAVTYEGIHDFSVEANLDLSQMMNSVTLPGIDWRKFDRKFEVTRLQNTTGDDTEATDCPVIAKPGMMFDLGRHRLLCGDSTDGQAVKKLFEKKKADMVFTDPLYGVSYKGTNNPNDREWEVIKGDDLRGDDLFKLIYNVFRHVPGITGPAPAIYVCYASKNHTIFERALDKAGLVIRQQLIWQKHMVLGHSDYHWAHEPIFYCTKENRATWHGDRTATTQVLNSSLSDFDQMKKEELIELLAKMKERATVWDISKDPAGEYVHPTQKPVALAEQAIHNSSPVRGLVYDPFAGSGSTLIAAEKNKRTCYLADEDRHYCDVIVQRYTRWCRENNIKGELKKNGRKFRTL